MKENNLFDRKSLEIIQGPKANWKELAKDCVCFANSAGGEIHIGIEDQENLPPVNKTINSKLVEKIKNVKGKW